MWRVLGQWNGKGAEKETLYLDLDPIRYFPLLHTQTECVHTDLVQLPHCFDSKSPASNTQTHPHPQCVCINIVLYFLPTPTRTLSDIPLIHINAISKRTLCRRPLGTSPD